MNQAEASINQSGQLDEILRRQRQAHLKNPYPSASERIDRMDRVIDMVVRHEAALCEAANADFGNRDVTATRAMDLVSTLDSFKYCKKHVKSWMKTEKRKSNFPLGLLGAKSTVEYLPLGVVGNISPWNFPVMLSLAPFANIFAAGNRGMIKPSELTPKTSQVMADIVSESFDTDELTVVQGEADVAAAFAALKFDHLLFTGSTSIARRVAQAAAPNLVPMTLELGGKNPVVISKSADLKLAAEKVMWAKTMNGGQICLCPDLIYVHQSQIDDFVQHCKDSASKLYPDFASDKDFTHIVSERHAKRLRNMAAEAESNGAEIIPLGEGSGRCVPPSLILNAPADTRVMQEETFGGLLSIKPYNDIEETIEELSQQEHPLALYYFGEDDAEIRSFSHRTLSGGMLINDLVAHCLQEDLPFGGVGDSGMGAYHGFDGFKNFSHARAIFRQSKMDPLKMIRPPFKQKLRGYIAKQIKP